MVRTAAICALVATALLAVGCGGSDESASEEDKQAITTLVDELNKATEAKDASELCLMMQPSGVEETFHGVDRCVKETNAILKAAGDQPELKVESIEIDGDLALVTFAGNAGGEVSFVREGSQWYLPLGSGEADAETDDPGETGDQ